MNKKAARSSQTFSPEGKKRMTIVFWSLGMLPILIIACLLIFQSEEDLPSVDMLNNPPELLASVVYADDGETELGKYWKVNRSRAEYEDISPYVTDALIATEDERFDDHSGVDIKSIGRAAMSFGTSGGASTISQQLAKMLFTLQMREREAVARAKNEEVKVSEKVGLASRLNEKARENIIAVRLEARYTKEEIITMYLNQFDFRHNAVGITNASRVYFNKSPKHLSKDEAAMLVGMCNNPNIFNPYDFRIRNYRQLLADERQVPEEQVSAEEIRKAREKDSLRAVGRRNKVLYNWLKNSEEGNKSLRTRLSRTEYELLKKKPLVSNYQQVDHKKGLAPYFRESVRKEVVGILSEKNRDGSLKYRHADGSPLDIYTDGLKIYTTLNADLQQHAEDAVERHLKENLQPKFDRNNRGLNHFPFSNSLTKDQVNQIMRASMKRSERYISMKAQGISEKEISAAFRKKIPMTVFSWKGDIDTVMSPYDSIRYYKSYLQAGLVSIEPQTGFVKAWVGGANMDHFAFDHVREGKRQVGSAIKPFIYASAFAMNVAYPCTQIPNIRHCIDLYDPQGNPDGQWCPNNSGGEMNGGMISLSRGLQMSMNNSAVAVMAKMGSKAGPDAVAKLLRSMDINLSKNDIVPAMCLGSMDMSLFELMGAQSAFVNKGIYNKPTTILRIEDRNGNVIYNANPASREAINEMVAYAVLKMMEGVVLNGTAATLRSNESWGGLRYPTAGKTGTTQNNADGWFVGLTPELATGVWVGAEDRGVRFRSTREGQGSRTAAPVYGYYMQQVYNDIRINLSKGEFEKPAGFELTPYYCEEDQASDVQLNNDVSRLSEL